MSENNNMEQNENLKETPKEAPATPAKKEKQSKPAEKKKPGVGQRISRFFREMKGELKKVSWPSKNQTFKNTLVVIACVIVVGIFVWIFDAIAGNLIDALLSLFKG